MTVGPSVGDPTSGQPVSQASATPVARGGYDPNPAPTHVDIDGQQVSLDELRSGYLRQQDYTRKTQELSTARAQHQAAMDLAEALRSDPVGTLREMAQAVGVDYNSLAPNPAEGDLGQPGDDLDPNDPQAQELIQLRQITDDLRTGLEAQETARLEAILDTQMAQVEQMAAQLGIEHNPDDVYEYAVNNNINDLVQAFRAMTWDQVAQAQSQQSPPLPDVRGLKQQVAFQQPRSGIAQQYTPTDKPEPTSIGEALMQVLDEAGIRDFAQVSYDDTNMVYGGP